MDNQKQADHTLIAAIAALLVLLFVLDVLTPLGIATWALYIVPLGLTIWSSIRSLLPITASAGSVLILLGYFYSPPGVSFEYAVINRSLGIVMLWVVVFLWKEKFGRLRDRHSRSERAKMASVFDWSSIRIRISIVRQRLDQQRRTRGSNSLAIRSLRTNSQGQSVKAKWPKDNAQMRPLEGLAFESGSVIFMPATE